MLDYAAKLTRTPSGINRKDVENLRAVGLDDRAIADVNMVSAYFNMINRVVEGLGVGQD